VLAAFEHNVEVWDLLNRCLVGSFPTVFDFGGSRVALSDELDVLVAAAYTRHGLFAYRPGSGERIWERRDLKRVQTLTLSADGTRVFCGREGFPCEVVDIKSGETVERLRGSDRVVESPWDPARFNDRLKPAIETLFGDTVCAVPRLTFAFLDATFAPGRLCVSESRGAVRCLSIASGHELWRYQPPSGAHVLQLAYRADDDSVVAVEWSFEHGGPRKLLSFSAADGVLRTRHEIEGTDHAFCRNGRCLVMSTREVLTSDSARVLYELCDNAA
jgi:outer membrane protein assembly factor BamB